MDSRSIDKDIPKVPGHIHLPKYVKFWKENFTLPAEVLKILQHGYIPPLLEWPPRSELPDNKSAREPAFRPVLLKQIQELLASRAISMVDKKPRCVMPLQLVHREGKEPRLVVDASRQLNPHIKCRKVRLTTLSEVNSGVLAGSWWSSLDLKSGYYHIKIHEDYRTLFGIKWLSNDGSIQYFIWNVCFLGINDLVRTFTKMMRPILGFFHENGIRADIYIDDIRCVANSKRNCEHHVEFIRSTLEHAGFIESVQKAVAPTQSGTFLGLVNDTRRLRYYIPRGKIDKILGTLHYFEKLKKAPVRDIASLYGKLAACKLATGPILRLLTRIGQRRISLAVNSCGWNGLMDIRPLHKEMRTLVGCLREINGFPFSGKELTVPIDCTLVSDASDTGFGVIKVSCGHDRIHKPHTRPCETEIVLKRKFLNDETKMSSTYRELLAIFSTYTSPEVLQRLRGCKIAHLTDNQGAAAIIRVGSRNPTLHHLALEVHSFCRQNDIVLTVHWRPREDPRLKQADARSRHFDNDDWGIDLPAFSRVQSFASRPFQIDLFATRDNAKCKMFVSKFNAEASEAYSVNAFALNWASTGFFFACPPPKLIVPTLLQAVSQRCCGVLICPRWPASHFWPYLLPDGNHFCKLVKKFKFFRPQCLTGPDVISTTFSGVLTFDMIMIEIKADISLPFSPNVVRSHCISNVCRICK